MTPRPPLVLLWLPSPSTRLPTSTLLYSTLLYSTLALVEYFSCTEYCRVHESRIHESRVHESTCKLFALIYTYYVHISTTGAYFMERTTLPINQTNYLVTGACLCKACNLPCTVPTLLSLHLHIAYSYSTSIYSILYCTPTPTLLLLHEKEREERSS